MIEKDRFPEISARKWIHIKVPGQVNKYEPCDFEKKKGNQKKESGNPCPDFSRKDHRKDQENRKDQKISDRLNKVSFREASGDRMHVIHIEKRL